jgi:transposase-like protein
VIEFNSLSELMKMIPDEAAACSHFKAILWKAGPHCPYCGSAGVYDFSDGRTHKCKDCRKRFSIKVGTIFEGTKAPLRKWLMAIWLITTHKKGIASTQLASDIGVTQKTAWFMLHRLRYAAQTKSFNAPLEGIVEADETFIGGKERNKHMAKRKKGTQGGSGKAIVLGMLQRDGDLRMIHVPSLHASEKQPTILKNVAAGSILMTDEHSSFNGLDDSYCHERVNHSAGQYVRFSIAHTNSIEGAWSLMKRQIIGTHHWISVKHLSRYLDEMSWRYNRRGMTAGMRVNAIVSESIGRLKYAELIA